MRKTTIQWCDNAVNPVMGCAGCELWPTTTTVHAKLLTLLRDKIPGQAADELSRSVLIHVPNDLRPSQVLGDLTTILAAILNDCGQSNSSTLTNELDAAVSSLFRFYAGHAALNHAGKVPGFPAVFEIPQLFPGKVVEAAAAPDLSGRIRPDKPWLNHLPRVISIGDLGECFSPEILFDWLKSEIIDVVATPNGQRHFWLWMTKHPRRMADFLKWLRCRGIRWPANLVPVASVTSQETVHRVRDLLQMHVPVRAVAVDPFWEAVELPLTGVDWVLAGAEVGPGARPFPLEAARNLKRDCEARGVPLFFSRLGQVLQGDSGKYRLRSYQGSDLSEWPIDLQVRKFPAAFSLVRRAKVSEVIKAA